EGGAGDAGSLGQVVDRDVDHRTVLEQLLGVLRIASSRSSPDGRALRRPGSAMPDWQWK
ncbi:transcriptional regulator, TetR family domain protein, partial [Mycobacterium ulcerans str. Harvey]